MFIDELCKKYPYRIMAHGGYEAIIHSVQPLTEGKEAPIYRFPGGLSVVDLNEPGLQIIQRYCSIDITVCYEGGTQMDTKINLPCEEAKEYYLGKVFNLGTSYDVMKRCIAVVIDGIRYEVSKGTELKSDKESMKIVLNHDFYLTALCDHVEVFQGMASEFLSDNDGDEEVTEMLNECYIHGSKTFSEFSGEWELVKENNHT